VSTAEDRLDEIAECEFAGKHVAAQIAQYATLTQRLAHDLARELANSEEAALDAIRRLQGHPMLRGLDVRWRARRVARVLREARALCEGVSAESVAFNVQFRHEFADALRRKKNSDYRERVDP
jgi:hypothetical protein